MTSEGIVCYQLCAVCGARRIDLVATDETPPTPLSAVATRPVRGFVAG